MGREGQEAEGTIADPHAGGTSDTGDTSDKGDTREGHEGREAAIALRGVTKRFGAVTAVKNVSFEIPSGSVFGLIGPNGAGKTTTFSMMAGYLAPTEGELALLDRAPRDVDALRGKVGVLPQDALLPPAEQVGEYLVFLGQLQGMTHAKATASAKSALAEVEGSDWWKVRCGTLSHGMG